MSFISAFWDEDKQMPKSLITVTSRLAPLLLWLMVVLAVQSFAVPAVGDDIAQTQTVSAKTPLPDAPSAAITMLLQARDFAADPGMNSLGEILVSNAFLPGNLSAPYKPLTNRGKFDLFLKHNSPMSLAGTAVDAAWAAHVHEWPGYGGGMQGYGKRYGALLADRESGSFFGSFLFPTMLHQDPRYFRMGEGNSVGRRLAYAASRVVITRNDNGAPSFNSSRVLASFASQSVANAYYPQADRGFSQTLNRTGASLLGAAQANLTREFLPDVERFFWSHLPLRVQHLEGRMPLSREWSPKGFSTVARNSGPNSSSSLMTQQAGN
jgi:hypothetical protein